MFTDSTFFSRLPLSSLKVCCGKRKGRCIYMNKYVSLHDQSQDKSIIIIIIIIIIIYYRLQVSALELHKKPSAQAAGTVPS